MSRTEALGEVPAPLLVFGGPYSNLEALRGVREVADRLRIPAGQCLCTGDLVAYCADPMETVSEIRDWGVHLVMGNCEESLAAGANDCGCGFDSGTRCDLLSKQWFDYANSRVTAQVREWMAQLPRSISFTFAGIKAAAIHGGATQINRFLFASQAEAAFEEEFDRLDVDLVLAGHCGIPFSRRIGDRLWHNAGVIGMPANDGRRETWYSLLQQESNGTIRISHHPLSYDAGPAALKMQAAGLTGGYDRTLLTGCWPSLDILPEKERMQAGGTLELDSPIRFGKGQV